MRHYLVSYTHVNKRAFPISGEITISITGAETKTKIESAVKEKLPHLKYLTIKGYIAVDKPEGKEGEV